MRKFTYFVIENSAQSARRCREFRASSRANARCSRATLSTKTRSRRYSRSPPIKSTASWRNRDKRIVEDREGWVQDGDAGELLAETVSELSAAKEEYRKTVHSVAVVRAMSEPPRGCALLEPLKDELIALLGAAR